MLERLADLDDDVRPALDELPAVIDRFVRVDDPLTTLPAAAFAREGVHALAGRAVSLSLPDRTVIGIARGVDANGLLLIEVDGRLESFMAGHVRLREDA